VWPKRISPYCHHNPVRDEIGVLRASRDAGAISETEFACRVADLLGALDAGILPRST